MRRQNLSHEVRERLVRYPEPHSAHHGVAVGPPVRTDFPSGEHSERHRAAIAAMATVDAWSTGGPDTFHVARILARQEALGSSAIEGTNSTLDELLRVEDTEDEDATAATRQVRDYAFVLQRLLPQARWKGRSVFDRELVAELHRSVMKEDPDYRDVPGHLRDRVVWIGSSRIESSIWNPPPPDLVPSLLDDTIAYMRDDDEFVVRQSLIVRMAIAHAHYEAVHPFRDGNGRVGRLLLPLMMAAEGHVPLYLSPYIAANTKDYSLALQGAQQRGDLSGMVGFMSSAIVDTVNELRVTRACLEGILEDWATRRRFRLGSASATALDVLTGHPVVTVKRLAELLGVSTKNAGEAVAQLVEAGILTERTGYARNRIFAAEEVLRIVNRPFGEDPEPDAIGDDPTDEPEPDTGPPPPRPF